MQVRIEDPGLAHERRRSAAAVLTHTVFVWVYDSNAAIPDSRPKPLAL